MSGARHRRKGDRERELFRKLRLKIEDDTVPVTTIALTPTRSITGGWSRSERMAERVLNILGLEFRLPPN
jgi:hypothetical protein